MKKNRLAIAILLLLFLNKQQLRAQDPFFSQYFYSSYSLNPALTGFTPDDILISMNYRNNNKSLINHKTYGFAGEMKIMRLRLSPDIAAFGVSFLQDGIPEIGIKNSNFMMSGAYHFALSATNLTFVSIGGQIGYYQISANPSNFQYPNQYNAAIGYDASISNNENFNKDNTSAPDLNLGAFGYHAFNEKILAYAGMSFYHLFTPKLTFLSSNNNQLNAKYILHGGTHISIGNNLSLSPGIMTTFQTKSKIINIGGIAEYQFPNQNTSVNIGNWYRANDNSYVIIAGARISRILFAISTELFSSLKSVTESGNAFELSILYSLSNRDVVNLEANPRNNY